MLVPAGPNEWNILAELKERFDDYGRDEEDPAQVDEALAWLAANGGVDGTKPGSPV